jgi:hypothetical protein
VAIGMVWVEMLPPEIYGKHVSVIVAVRRNPSPDVSAQNIEVVPLVDL